MEVIWAAPMMMKNEIRMNEEKGGYSYAGKKERKS